MYVFASKQFGNSERVMHCLAVGRNLMIVHLLEADLLSEICGSTYKYFNEEYIKKSLSKNNASHDN